MEQRSLADYSQGDCKRVGHDLATKQQQELRKYNGIQWPPRPWDRNRLSLPACTLQSARSGQGPRAQYQS